MRWFLLLFIAIVLVSARRPPRRVYQEVAHTHISLNRPSLRTIPSGCNSARPGLGANGSCPSGQNRRINAYWARAQVGGRLPVIGLDPGVFILTAFTQAAYADYALPVPCHDNNGDEDRYAALINTYTKGMPHDNITGTVDPTAYAAWKTAYTSGLFTDFERVPLGGQRKFVNPVGGLVFELEGADAGAIYLPPAPQFSSAEQVCASGGLLWKEHLSFPPP
jgi:hypothetical protein